MILLENAAHQELLDAKAERDRLHALINQPQTEDFVVAVRAEMAHQVERWGEAHDRGKSAENWFWLIGYLAGKALRSAITGDRKKALHHCVSSAAAAGNWFKAISADTTGTCIGRDEDLRPIEIARFEGEWQRDNESVLCTLLLVGGHSVEAAAIATWTDEQCRQAQEWAMREHLHASDNDDVERVPMPPWVAAHPPEPSTGGLWD